jgi:hypothetical protein
MTLLLNYHKENKAWKTKKQNKNRSLIFSENKNA